MAEKKRTFTCKVCGGEHSGLICTKFTSVKVLPRQAPKAPRPLLLLTGPKPATKKKRKAPKKRRKSITAAAA
jgi:hypothetical protein